MNIDEEAAKRSMELVHSLNAGIMTVPQLEAICEAALSAFGRRYAEAMQERCEGIANDRIQDDGDQAAIILQAIRRLNVEGE